MPARSLVDEGPEYDRARAAPHGPMRSTRTLTPFDGDLDAALLIGAGGAEHRVEALGLASSTTAGRAGNTVAAPAPATPPCSSIPGG
jgi:hypothetical protein